MDTLKLLIRGRGAVPDRLEPAAGVSQCNYELLRAFDGYMRNARLRWSLGAGTLLGAMRNRPPGLLQWEHDVDAYVPARDASALLRRLRRDGCDGRRPRSRWCRRALELRFSAEPLDRGGRPCCGWGFKLYHRRSSACELDVLVLALSDAPLMHGETALWPIWAPPLAPLWRWLAASWLRGRYYVIVDDVYRKRLMADDGRWCDAARTLGGGAAAAVRAETDGEWAWCGGPHLSFFQDEYFAHGELFPLRRRAFYDLRLPVPHDPWALLNRTYGADCAVVARMNEHDDAEADLRRPEFRYLTRPARVRTGWRFW